MSSNHIKVRKSIKELEKSDFILLLDRMMLSSNEEQIMKLYYIKHKTMLQIADELGYSEAGVVKAHQRILKQISRII